MFDVAIPVHDIAAVGDARAPRWALAGAHTDIKGHLDRQRRAGTDGADRLVDPRPAGFAGVGVQVRPLDIGLDDDGSRREVRPLAAARHGNVSSSRQGHCQ